MFNKYTVEVYEVDNQVKATIYIGKDCLGSIWNPTRYIKDKPDFHKLFESVGNVIYGQEQQAKKKEESDSKILKAIEAQNKREQETIQKEEA